MTVLEQKGSNQMNQEEQHSTEILGQDQKTGHKETTPGLNLTGRRTIPIANLTTTGRDLKTKNKDPEAVHGKETEAVVLEDLSWSGTDLLKEIHHNKMVPTETQDLKKEDMLHHTNIPCKVIRTLDLPQDTTIGRYQKMQNMWITLIKYHSG